jgi:ABC-type oligopeptide transport system substrate-binding subunit
MKMNRKIMAVGTAAIASAAMCGASLLTGITPVASAASSVVTIPYPADNLETLDPIDWSGEILIDQGTLFEGLYGYNTKNQIVPKIATKAVPSAGGRVWTIYLRHNARWSNGQPVTAEDFYYAWMRLLAPNDSNGAIWSGVTNNIFNGYAYHAGAVPASKVGIDVVNNYELRVTLSGAMNIKGLLALSASMPLYPPDVEQHPSDWFDPPYFVGDGPYVVKKFTPNGELVTTRNPHYVGTPGQYDVGNIQQIDFIPGPTVGVEDFVANTLDGTVIGSPSDYRYALEHLASQVHKQPVAQLNMFNWDHSSLPSPLNNALVREAIAMAINRQPIVNPVLNNMAGVTNVFGYPGFPTYKLEHNPYSYNVAAARKLLAKAGYPNGKGMPELHIYTQTTTNSATSVLIGEAVAQELKSNLNLNFKISPINSTEFGAINWGGLYQGIEPGYVIGSMVANWNQTLQWPLQSNQWSGSDFSGSIGSQAFRQYAATNWYYSAYDPRDVKLWGNPTDNSLGVSYSQWQPIIASAQKDIAYLNAWTAKQPPAYRAALNPPGSVPLTAQLANFEASYKAAKTSAAKHAAWVAFWKWVGTYQNGAGGASLGLNAQVYYDQHEPALEAQINEWDTELSNTGSSHTAAVLSADIANAMIKSGYMIPLNYAQEVYLEKSDLTGLQVNPWSWNNFYQFQYMKLK